jgi:hypothetical protein
LKIKAFIYEKSLDTPLFRLIRFCPESFDGLCLPLELFSLEKREGRPVAGRPFRFVRALLHCVAGLNARLLRPLNFSELRRNSDARFPYHLLSVMLLSVMDEELVVKHPFTNQGGGNHVLR